MESLSLSHSATILDSLPMLTYTPGSPESQQLSAIQSSVLVGMYVIFGASGQRTSKSMIVIIRHNHINVETWRALTCGSKNLQDKWAAISTKHVHAIGKSYKFPVLLNNFHE